MSHFWDECVAREICHYVSSKLGVAMGLTRPYIRAVGLLRVTKDFFSVITDPRTLIRVTQRLSVIFGTI